MQVTIEMKQKTHFISLTFLFIEGEQPYEVKFIGSPHLLDAIYTSILITLPMLREEWWSYGAKTICK
jgi:hypothetical protein